MNKIILGLYILFFTTSIFSWSNHTYGTFVSLSAMKEVKDAEPVVVEKLEDFISKEQNGLISLFNEQENFCKANIKNYRPRPDGIKFSVNSDPKVLKKSFLNAIRINPNSKLLYYIQEIPGTDYGKKIIYKENVTTFEKDEYTIRYLFTELKEKSTVPPLYVISTAADEPDYGLDVGLFEDNKTEFGKEYNFGIQPFGNPELVYASQAPFHIGYYHESSIIFTLAPFLNQTMPEYRIYQYLSLAKFAFKTGHKYWGWRFLGWALHYIQDLTQPYHAKVIPGSGTGKMLLIDGAAIIGFKGWMDKTIKGISDRHLSLENYNYLLVTSKLREKKDKHPLLLAFQEVSRDTTYGKFELKNVRDTISKESYGRANDLDEVIEDFEALASFKDLNYDINKFEKTFSSYSFEIFINEMMKSFGSHSRNAVRSVLAD